VIGEQGHDDPGHAQIRYYAYCSCGVCGPIRTRREDAEADDSAHQEVCSAQAKAIGYRIAEIPRPRTNA
jgi:hypothetical protein